MGDSNESPNCRITDFETRLRSADPRVRRYAQGIVGRSAVDDVLQESYLKAFRAYDRFRGDAEFSTWLFRIVHNTCLTHHQRTRFTQQLDDDLLAPTSAETDRVADRLDFETAFAALPRKHREAVLLVILEGYSYDSAAAILGVRRGTVASRVNRARTALSSALTSGDTT